ncbi:MAG TPA: CPBP family intramembrane glutamic endopeptidase [Sphingorhabdus sp.]|nr:CPBP family intramembrane glutamic endopeptidase [Sphingorhabdus sp.]
MLAYVGLAIVGVVTLGSPEAVAAMVGKLGFSPAGDAQGPLSAIWSIMLFTLVAALPGIVIGVSSALGEEIGWRGYLVPKLMERMGFWGTTLVSGCIWGVWHMPILLFGNYNNGTEWWYGMTCFVILVLSGSMIMTWLRLRSASVWPCAIFHGSHNLFIQVVFASIALSDDPDAAYYVGEFGAAAPLAMLLFCAVLYFRMNKTAHIDK